MDRQVEFKRGDKVIYTGPFVNFHGECTYLCEADKDGLAVLRHHGGSIESVHVNANNLVLA